MRQPCLDAASQHICRSPELPVEASATRHCSHKWSLWIGNFYISYTFCPFRLVPPAWKNLYNSPKSSFTRESLHIASVPVSSPKLCPVRTPPHPGGKSRAPVQESVNTLFASRFQHTQKPVLSQWIFKILFLTYFLIYEEYLSCNKIYNPEA